MHTVLGMTIRELREELDKVANIVGADVPVALSFDYGDRGHSEVIDGVDAVLLTRPVASPYGPLCLRVREEEEQVDPPEDMEMVCVLRGRDCAV